MLKSIVIGIISSVVSVILIFYVRTFISIKCLKNNYVCADRFYYISEAIEKFETYANCLITYYDIAKKPDIETWKSFYKKYSFVIFLDVVSLLNSIENEIAIENIKHSMGFEWNFKLMTLINKVEISSYSLRSDYEKLEKNDFIYYKEWNDNFANTEEKDLLMDISNYDSFLISIKNNIEAWKTLIVYFGYDYSKKKENLNNYSAVFNEMKKEYLRTVIKKKKIDINGKFDFNSKYTTETLLIRDLLREQLVEIKDEYIVATDKGLQSI